MLSDSPSSPVTGKNGAIVLKVTAPSAETFILLNSNTPTLHENEGAVSTSTGPDTQAALHAGAPINGIAINAPAATTTDLRLRIVASSCEPLSMHPSSHDTAPSSGYTEGRIKRLSDAVAT